MAILPEWKSNVPLHFVIDCKLTLIDVFCLLPSGMAFETIAAWDVPCPEASRFLKVMSLARLFPFSLDNRDLSLASRRFFSKSDIRSVSCWASYIHMPSFKQMPATQAKKASNWQCFTPVVRHQLTYWVISLQDILLHRDIYFLNFSGTLKYDNLCSRECTSEIAVQGLHGNSEGAWIGLQRDWFLHSYHADIGNFASNLQKRFTSLEGLICAGLIRPEFRASCCRSRLDLDLFFFSCSLSPLSLLLLLSGTCKYTFSSVSIGKARNRD